MQTSKLALNKRLYCILIISLLTIIFFTLNNPTNFNNRIQPYVRPLKTNKSNVQTTSKTDTKYILLWSSVKNTPFSYFGEGRAIFLSKNCTYNNCYVTNDRGFLGDYTEFEAIAFNGPQLNYLRYTNDLPSRRHSHQKYIYANIESADTYPICSRVWNDYFNWTWTYRLDSSTVWNYFTILDKNNTIIGPKKDMHWLQIDEMDPIDSDLKIQLSTKTRAAAWFVSNCNTMSRREEFVKTLQDHLRDFNLEVDIYGECGSLQCPRTIMSRCLNMVERKYFFYLAFENSISEDYVTEKVLYALQHNTVPVVFGGANYTRFMPKDIYLDARELGVRKLAEKMFQIIHNMEIYHTFFRWKKYYSYHYTHERPDSDVYCKFCETLNTQKLVTKTVFEHLDQWWTPQHVCGNGGYNIPARII